MSDKNLTDISGNTSQEAPPMARYSLAAVVVAGLAAGTLGLVLAGPTELLLMKSAAALAPVGDMAQALSGAFAFIRDTWRFPLFDVAGLTELGGSNIIFTDSIPLYAGLWKLLGKQAENWLAFYIPIFVVITFLMQGVASAFVLRRLGVNQFSALFFGACIVVFWPAFLFRLELEHLALASHWVILFAIGLLITGNRKDGVFDRDHLAWCALAAAGLLVHAYLFGFVFACFCARLVVDLATRKADREALLAFRLATYRLSSFLAVSVGVMFVSGHLGGGSLSIGGYGYYSMNLAAPFIAHGSSMFMPDWTDFPAGQIDGFNYFPVAVIAILLLAAGHGRPGYRPDGRVMVLSVFALAVTVFAVSNQIYWGSTLLAAIPIPHFALEVASIYRGSGRFFWVISYLVLLPAIATLARRYEGWRASGLLALVVLAVVIEMRPLRNSTEPKVGTIASDSAILNLMSRNQTVAIYPPYTCGATGVSGAHHELQLIAARSGAILSNSLVSARPDIDCLHAQLNQMEQPPHENSVAILLGGERKATAALANADVDAGNCRIRNDLVFCTSGWKADAFLDEAFRRLGESEVISTPASFGFGRDDIGTLFLMSGFSAPENWGTWSLGFLSKIVLPLDQHAMAPETVSLLVRGFTPVSRPRQHIRVVLESMSGKSVRWREEAVIEQELEAREKPYRLVLNRPPVAARSLRITIHVSEPLSPHALGINDDRRQLGIALIEARLEPSF